MLVSFIPLVNSNKPNKNEGHEDNQTSVNDIIMTAVAGEETGASSATADKKRWLPLS